MHEDMKAQIRSMEKRQNETINAMMQQIKQQSEARER